MIVSKHKDKINQNMQYVSIFQYFQNELTAGTLPQTKHSLLKELRFHSISPVVL